MSPVRRSLLAAAGGIAALEIAGTGSPTFAHASPEIDKEVARLIELSLESNTALMRGDVNRYRALVPVTDDFTLMSPFGGEPTHASALTSESWEAMGKFFRNGTFGMETVQAYGSADMVVLALIERANVEVGALPAQDWALRVTLVYRRVGSEWQLAHRHADPLVAGITHQQAADLARGDALYSHFGC